MKHSFNMMMPDYTYWVLHFKGIFYDPEFGIFEKCHPDGKITSYLEIHIE
ncbi:hypothetical protein [Tissierella pigra]|nr:hypothetical protein [Tissierella pigra]